MGGINRRELLGIFGALLSQEGGASTTLAPAFTRQTVSEKNAINYMCMIFNISEDQTLNRLLASTRVTPDDFDDNNTPAHAADYVFSKASEYLDLRRRLTAHHGKNEIKNAISFLPKEYSPSGSRTSFKGFPLHDGAKKKVLGARAIDNHDIIDHLTGEAESPSQLLRQILSSMDHKDGLGCLGKVDDLELQKLTSKHFPTVWEEMKTGKHQDLQRRLKIDKKSVQEKPDQNSYDQIWAEILRGNDYY